MIHRPTANAIYTGVLAEIIDSRNQQLITESGVLGGDLLPRAFAASTVKHLEDQLAKISRETEDSVDVRVVGSGRYGAENRHVFGDLDVVMRMGKPETLSRIKDWVWHNAENIRDIDSKKHGENLKPDTLGDKFSFLYPIFKDDGEHLTIGELRAILAARFGATDWKKNHDERLRVQANMKNLAGKGGTAMVQIDVMRAIVDGMEAETLVDQARGFADKLRGADIENASQYHEFLTRFLDDQEIEEFEDHYEFLRTHGKLQDTESQQLLTAIYYMRHKDEHKDHLGKRVDSVVHRYSHHPDGLQLIYYIAGQLGVQLDDQHFTRESLGKLVDGAIKAGIAGDKLTVDLLRNPAEAWATLKGKHKEQAQAYIMANTKNKRSEESNPDALYRNYGTRAVRAV